MKRTLNTVKKIACDIQAQGGRAYYVGGYVRDALLDKESKDIDIEVYNIPIEKLKLILSKYGNVDEVGAFFGILIIKGLDVDFSIPRIETKTSMGHKGFDVGLRHDLSIEEASKRRDFTINSMMKDVLTGEIIDLWGGKLDLKKGIIRHVSDDTFIEDPLRVLRACQFASRFEFDIDDNTLELCKKLNLEELPRERVFEELKKALLKAKKPSIFFENLFKMNQMDTFFKEIKALKGVEQPIKYHPEGDVWNHTMLVLDECAKIRHLSSDKLAFMLSGLCHDLGKPIVQTIVNNQPRFPMHEEVGIEIADNFIKRLTLDKKLRKYILNMVELHMNPNRLFEDKSSLKATRRMFARSLYKEDLILIAKADHLGRLNFSSYEDAEIWLNNRLEDFYETCSLELVNGEDLINAGYVPGKEFKSILEFAFKLQTAGLDKESILKQVKALYPINQQ